MSCHVIWDWGAEPSDAFRSARPGRVDPGRFLRRQWSKHDHVQVRQVWAAGGCAYLVIGYDKHWNEIERTRLTEDGRILGHSDPEASAS